MTNRENPLKLRGIEFIEFSSEDPKNLDELFKAFVCLKSAKVWYSDDKLSIQEWVEPNLKSRLQG